MFSLEATVLGGDHMALRLDGFDIEVACYGNHGFRFTEEKLVEIAQQASVSCIVYWILLILLIIVSTYWGFFLFIFTFRPPLRLHNIVYLFV